MVSKTILAAALTLAAAAIGVSAAHASARSHIDGSAIVAIGPYDYHLVIHAVAAVEGVAATGTARYSSGDSEAIVEVKCIADVGGLVVVGGLVTSTKNMPPMPPTGAVFVVDDRGPAAKGVTDQIGWGFGPVTPSVTCTADPAIFGLRPINAGNFATRVAGP